MASEGEGKVLDFAQSRANALADAIRGLVEQMQFTNRRIERLTRDLAEFRSETLGRLDRIERDIERDIRDARSELVLQANQILNAQQAASQVVLRLEEVAGRPTAADPEAG